MGSLIKLKFFRKLELFQELRSENKKAKNAGGTKKELWNMEKDVLEWTVNNHHHRASALRNEDIQNIVRDYKEEEMDNELGEISKNLISREFAKQYEEGDCGSGIIILREGFLMGEVIKELKGHKRFFYRIFIILVWATVAVGTLTVIWNFIGIICNVIFSIFHSPN